MPIDIDPIAMEALGHFGQESKRVLLHAQQKATEDGVTKIKDTNIRASAVALLGQDIVDGVTFCWSDEPMMP